MKHNLFLHYTYGIRISGKLIKKTTMKNFASQIAYLYRKHLVILYVSYNSKNFMKASGVIAKTFDKIMNNEFRLDE